MAELRVERVADEGGVHAYYSVDTATRSADHVGLPADPPAELLPQLGGEAAGHRVELWLGLAGGVPVAAADLRLPLHDNPDAANLDIRVTPDHRRRGIGRAMLAHTLDRIRAHGRHRVFAGVAEPLDGDSGDGPTAPGPAFASAAGARPVLTEVRRLLDLNDLPASRLCGLRAEAEERAAGYTVVQWIDRAPAEVIDDLAVLAAQMSTEAPMEEMAWEPEVWTAQRYRAREDSTIARRRRRFASAARHEASGRIVGFTDLAVSTVRPEVGYQWDTLVVPEHRGHRLGLLLKAANLMLLRDREPSVRLVNTWNAAINDHMVAINDTLGFRPVERWRQWQLDLGSGGQRGGK